MQATAGKALSVETKLLKQYDYAWNTRQAGCQPRHVNIVTHRSCFSKTNTLVSCPALPAKSLKGIRPLGLEDKEVGPLKASLPSI